MKILSHLLLFFLLAPCLQAQEPAVTFIGEESAMRDAKPRDTLRLLFVIKPNCHIPSEHPDDQELAPTRIDWDYFPPRFIMELPEYPDSQPFTVNDRTLQGFSDTLRIKVPFKTSNQRAGTYKVTGELHYQPCHENECDPPETLDFRVDIEH